MEKLHSLSFEYDKFYYQQEIIRGRLSNLINATAVASTHLEGINGDLLAELRSRNATKQQNIILFRSLMEWWNEQLQLKSFSTFATASTKSEGWILIPLDYILLTLVVLATFAGALRWLLYFCHRRDPQAFTKTWRECKRKVWTGVAQANNAGETRERKSSSSMKWFTSPMGKTFQDRIQQMQAQELQQSPGQHQRKCLKFCQRILDKSVSESQFMRWVYKYYPEYQLYVDVLANLKVSGRLTAHGYAQKIHSHVQLSLLSLFWILTDDYDSFIHDQSIPLSCTKFKILQSLLRRFGLKNAFSVHLTIVFLCIVRVRHLFSVASDDFFAILQAQHPNHRIHLGHLKPSPVKVRNDSKDDSSSCEAHPRHEIIPLSREDQLHLLTFLLQGHRFPYFQSFDQLRLPAQVWCRNGCNYFFDFHSLVQGEMNIEFFNFLRPMSTKFQSLFHFIFTVSFVELLGYPEDCLIEAEHAVRVNKMLTQMGKMEKRRKTNGFPTATASPNANVATATATVSSKQVGMAPFLNAQNADRILAFFQTTQQYLVTMTSTHSMYRKCLIDSFAGQFSFEVLSTMESWLLRLSILTNLRPPELKTVVESLPTSYKSVLINELSIQNNYSSPAIMLQGCSEMFLQLQHGDRTHKEYLYDLSKAIILLVQLFSLIRKGLAQNKSDDKNKNNQGSSSRSGPDDENDKSFNFKQSRGIPSTHFKYESGKVLVVNVVEIVHYLPQLLHGPKSDLSVEYVMPMSREATKGVSNFTANSNATNTSAASWDYLPLELNGERIIRVMNLNRDASDDLHDDHDEKKPGKNMENPEDAMVSTMTKTETTLTFVS